MGEQGWANERKPSDGKREGDVKPKPEDDEDAFEALEAEQKEFLKVCNMSHTRYIKANEG